MSDQELKNLVLPGEGGGEIKEWIPEDFGFNARSTDRDVFYKGKYELRRKKYNNWLLRKRVRNERGNTEMLVKWGMIVIEPQETEFAEMMFTLGLR
jgi:hypothetical protein